MGRAGRIANPTLSLLGQIEFRGDCVTLPPRDRYFHFGQLSANIMPQRGGRSYDGSFIIMLLDYDGKKTRSRRCERIAVAEKIKRGNNVRVARDENARQKGRFDSAHSFDRVYDSVR